MEKQSVLHFKIVYYASAQNNLYCILFKGNVGREIIQTWLAVTVKNCKFLYHKTF